MFFTQGIGMVFFATWIAYKVIRGGGDDFLLPLSLAGLLPQRSYCGLPTVHSTRARK